MLSLLDSGKIKQMKSSFWTCVISVPMSERRKVAEAAIRAFCIFAESSFPRRTQLVETPGLLSSLAILCGEETLLRNSEQIVHDIGRLAFYLSCLSTTNAALLVEAGWADLLVKAIRARPDDIDAVTLIIIAIHPVLEYGPISCRTAFIAAGAIAALQETIERYSPESNSPTSRYITKRCTEGMEVLMKE
mmetsp:Transcript_24016/g.34408  ORF Transcript_24016/g.34408 Transcript_24016/m.34408 type:complete len:190 (+) Transcript_24016:441-1010(+)